MTCGVYAFETMEEMAGIKQFLIYTIDYVFHIIDHYCSLKCIVVSWSFLSSLTRVRLEGFKIIWNLLSRKSLIV